MKKLTNWIKKIADVRSWFGLAAAGLVIGIICTCALVLRPRDLPETEAVIRDIRVIGEGQEEAGYEVTVEYEVEGRTYTRVIGDYDSRWKVGDTIVCEYDPDDPGEVRAAGGWGMAAVLAVIGYAAAAFGTVRCVRGLRKPVKSYDSYDRVDPAGADPALAQEVLANTEPVRSFGMHYAGKLNQGSVMKREDGTAVYEAVCERMTFFRDTPFTFRDLRTGAAESHMVSHTVTTSAGSGSAGVILDSRFQMDGEIIWDLLAKRGYSFDVELRGLTCCFRVKKWGVGIGSIETAGSEVRDPKYEGKALGKIPSNGIFRVFCQESEIPAMFLIAFSIARTELSGF